MALPTGFWGIDIGQCGLKALRLEMIDGKPTATAFDFIEHPKILSQPDADPDQLTREALEKFLSRNQLQGDHVAVAVAGQSGLARFVKLPPVEEKKIGDIVKFEAKQQIPFPLEEVVWDYQKIAGGDVAGGFAMETEIGLFAMKRDNIARALGHFTTAGIDVHLVQMAPLAICNYATYELLGKGGPDGSTEPGAPIGEGEQDETPRGKKRCAVVMDIGTDASNLIITDGGKIIWQRPLPLGGNNFTRALTKEMKLTFAKAEHLKRNAAKSPDLPQILRALRPVLTDFVGEVQRSLGYFTNTHRDAHVAYMVGLGNAFKLPGLQKYLSEKLSLDVRKPVGASRLAGDQVTSDPVFTENILSFPIAYGLALQGIGQARLLTNLLPPEIRVDRQIRQKKPWAAAAAAALLLGTGTVAGAYALQNNKVTDDSVMAAKKKLEDAVKSSSSQDSERRNKETELATTITQVKSIIAGQDERLNWIRLNEVITAALPRPGENGNLLAPNQVPFWNSVEGKRALAKYQSRVSQGLPADRAWEDDMSQYLATVNIESMYTRFTDDVKGFIDRAYAKVDSDYGEQITKMWPDADKEKDETTGKIKPKITAEGAANVGWIVELRGYTYHKDATTGFLDRCLLDNFNKLNSFAAATELDPKTGKPKVDSVIAGMVDPIKGKVQYPFLYLKLKSKSQLPNQFSHINGSVIDGLIGGATDGAMPGKGAPGGGGGGGSQLEMGGGNGSMNNLSDPAGGGAAATVSSFSNWFPATGGGGAAGGGSETGGSGGMYAGMMAGRGGKSGGMSASIPGMPSGGPGVTTGGGGGGGGIADGPSGTNFGGSETGNRGANKVRTEFILIFVWREPTPSDPTLGADGQPLTQAQPADPAKP
ncbi:MAG: type IV pilus assembly protein PilM [Gemmataceae bacterium]